MSENSNTPILAALERLENGQTQIHVDLMARMDVQDEILARFRIDLIEELGRTRSALMARMDRLQEALVRQHEDDTVNFGAAERAERIAKGAVDEGRILGEQFNALVRQVRRLEEDIRTLRGGI